MLIDSLLVIYKFTNNDSLKFEINKELSLELKNSDFSKAIEYSLLALEDAMQSDDENIIASAYLLVGSRYLEIGNYEESFKYFLKSLQIFENLQDHFNHAKVIINIGVIYDRLENYDKALDYYYQALNIAHTKNIPELNKIIQTLYNNIGNIYNSKLEYNEAKEYYYKALHFSVLNNDEVLSAIIQNNLGKLYCTIGILDSAYINLQKAIELRQKINDQYGLAKSYYFLSDYYERKGDFKEALNSALKSNAIAKKIGAIEAQQISMMFIYKLNYKLGNYKESIDAHVLYKDLSDSLINEQTTSQITRMQMNYEMDKKEKDQLLAVQKIKLRYILTIGIFLIVILFIGILYLFLRNRSRRIELQRDNLEKDLELKNKELTTNVMYQVKLNELLNDISGRLLKIKSKLKEENKAPIQRIIFELQAANEEDVWKEFEIRFGNVHEDFYKKLRYLFPDLTQSEEKLCALLKLGLSTKEISSLMNINLKSVDVARTRLRKKLKLTNTETNLYTYLNEF